MQLFYQPDLASGQSHLTEDESRHTVKVLRLKQGDQIDITDGQGTFYKANIEEANPKRCSLDIISKTEVSPCPVYRHIAIAPTKNIDRIEWFVEKAVEFGIDRITPILCDHSERKVVKTDRLLRKAVSAMKQSVKAYLPQIDELCPLKTILDTDAPHKFIAYVDFDQTEFLKDHIQSEGHHLILIGPEGDFSPNEVSMAESHNFMKVSLGNSRLRTETAGIAATQLLNL